MRERVVKTERPRASPGALDSVSLTDLRDEGQRNLGFEIDRVVVDVLPFDVDRGDHCGARPRLAAVRHEDEGHGAAGAHVAEPGADRATHGRDDGRREGDRVAGQRDAVEERAGRRVPRVQRVVQRRFGVGRRGDAQPRRRDAGDQDHRFGLARLVRLVARGRHGQHEGQSRKPGDSVHGQCAAHSLSSCAPAFLVIRGVMKIRSSVFLRLTDLLRNSQPRPGILESPGTPAWVTESFSLKMPPMTAVPPSATRIWVDALSVRMGGTSPTRLTKSGDELSTLRSMMMVFSRVICGMTSSFSDAEMNSTLIWVAVVLTTGICVPCSMVAFWLFWVAMRGAESTFTSPFSSNASSVALILKVSSTLPKLMPSDPAVAAAGR